MIFVSPKFGPLQKILIAYGTGIVPNFEKFATSVVL